MVALHQNSLLCGSGFIELAERELVRDLEDGSKAKAITLSRLCRDLVISKCRDVRMALAFSCFPSPAHFPGQ